MNWKKHFADVILERGYVYYKNNAVELVKASDNIIDANVQGYHLYNLRINLNNNEMYCNCPFEGKCKHLAATLYYMDSHPEVMKDNEDFLGDVSDELLREFLKEELANNEELLNRFIVFTNQDIDEDFYITKLKNACVNPYDVYKFIDEDIQFLIRFKKYSLILKLCDILVLYIGELESEHMWNDYEVIYDKLKSLLCYLSDLECKYEVKDFLAKVILETDDEALCDGFSYIYSKFGDAEELFE